MVGIVNNYLDISFNFGPTLLSWMERADPEGYGHILAADRLSVERRAGHGNAMAQAYNHLIMPLASARDRRTQVAWGVADFTHRFSRAPEGMWLPECAADDASLRDLADAGLAFTVLSPYQARRVRKRGLPGPRGGAKRKGRWEDASGGKVDTTRPYWVDLGQGRRIAVFFYDGDLSNKIAFQGLLHDGVRFGDELAAAARRGSGSRLAHVATDGESYGHHHRFGDMALASALQRVRETKGVTLTNYGEYLAAHPPEYEVQIHNPSSWSCAHGVGRWSRDCGCNMGSGRHQRWRQPLREALDYLKGELDALFEAEGAAYLRDPWAARDGYVWVLLDPGDQYRNEFLAEHAVDSLRPSEVPTVWRLLELQRHGMLMFTSCGWFFDEISRIEGVQVLRYALRALQLAQGLGLSPEVEASFRDRLRAAPSNEPQFGDGEGVLDRCALPAKVDPDRILAGHAIGACLDDPPEHSAQFCYRIDQADHARESHGATAVAVGRVRLQNRMTQEEDWAAYAVLHFGAHDFTCKIRRFDSIEQYDAARAQVLQAFSGHSMREAVLAVEAAFPGEDHDARDLFLDNRRALIARVLEDQLERLASGYARIFRENRKLMEFLAEIEIPVPREFAVAAGYVLEHGLRTTGEALRVGAEVEGGFAGALRAVEEHLDEAARLRLDVPRGELERALQERLERETEALGEDPSLARLDRSLAIARLVRRRDLAVRTWRSENAVFRFLRSRVRELEQQVRFGDPKARVRYERALDLVQAMGFDPDVAVEDAPGTAWMR